MDTDPPTAREIRFTCADCNQAVEVPTEAMRHERMACPGCGKPLLVPLVSVAATAPASAPVLKAADSMPAPEPGTSLGAFGQLLVIVAVAIAVISAGARILNGDDVETWPVLLAWLGAASSLLVFGVLVLILDALRSIERHVSRSRLDRRS